MKKSPTRFLRRINNTFTSATLYLDFQNMTTMDSRVTFTRASGGTYFDGSGVLRTAGNNVARFDHNPTTGESLGLLVEEQRTNLLTYSEDFSNAAWISTNTTVTANAATSPSGTTTADNLVATTTNGEHITDQTFSCTTGTSYTFSAFVKANGLTDIGLRFTVAANWTGSTSPQVRFDLSTVTALTISGSPASSSIVAVGNGWFRVSMTVAAIANGTPGARLQLMSGSANVFAGNGTSGVLVWGAQLEAGAFPTSYIATTAAAATRNADAASMTGTNFSSWYRADEGSIYIEAVSAPVNTIVQRYFSISDGTNNNIIFGRRTTSGFSAVAVNTNSATQGDISSGSAISGGASFKSIFAYQVNNLAISTNAASLGTDTSALIPVVSRINIGSTESVGQLLNGTIKKLAFYPTRLSNAQLQALTR